VGGSGRLENTDAIKWQPTTDTWVAVGTYVLVVAGIMLAFRVFTTAQVALNFITYGLITLAGLGVILPVCYTRVIRHAPLDELGITTRNLLPSLLLGGLLGLDTYRATLSTLNITWDQAVVPIVALALTVGLFEAVFFRGWLQLRFEAAFGLVPGLILAALAYSLYHIGYGMDASEMAFLFGMGLVFGGMFRLTKNILVVWPLYTPIGGLYENLRSGLTMPFEATYGFAIALALMIGIIIFAARWTGQQRRQSKPTTLRPISRT
jgi:membrane protease YdiL (CAAX protease family)